jgi:hypothetical protein
MRGKKQQQTGPDLADLYGPDPPAKLLWLDPAGGEEFLVQACEEIQRYAAEVAWTPERKAHLMSKVKWLAISFRFHQWLEAPSVSKTNLSRYLRIVSDHVNGLCTMVRGREEAVEVASHHYSEGEERFWELILKQLPQLAAAFQASLADPDFRKKGRPRTSHNSNVILVHRTRELMREYAGRPPGFTRQGGPGPLLRTVKAIYEFATGQPAENFDRYIAQAEQLLK